jgi:hypothetical protein
VLALAAIIAIVAAVWVSRGAGSGAPAPSVEAGAVLAPALKESLDAVAGVRIADAAHSIELRRDDSGVWRAASLDGLPANGDAVTRLIMTAANIGPGEPKTADPARYAEIGVEDTPTHPDAARVDFLDAQGTVVTAVIFGKLSESVIGDRFARVVGESRARLVRVPIVVKPMLREWVDLGITRIGADRVVGVSVQPMDAPPILVERPSPDAPTLEVIGAPADRTTNPDTVRALVGALGWLDFEHVRAATGEPDAPSLVTTTFRLREGWSLEVRTWREGGVCWARIAAVVPMTPLEGEGAAQTLEEIEAARERFLGWDFRIAEARFDSLRPTLEALTMQSTPVPTP